MRRILKSLLGVFVCLCCVSVVQAQQSNVSNETSVAGSVPRLVRFSGALAERRGAGPAAAGAARLSFSIYDDQAGGAALWSEIQDVRVDAQGRYSVLLGSASSDGLPAELFSTAGARWLGVQVEGRGEEARVLLVAVPYALKAADSDTLGGKPATAFVASEQLIDQVRDEVKTQVTESGSATRTLVGTAPTPQALGEGQSSFICNLAADCVAVTQSGAGVGLHATTPTGSAVLGELSSTTSGAAVYGRATATTGAASAVQGDAAAPNAVGVLGRAFGTTGTAKGIFGRSFSTSGTGVHGDATATTGATRGVWGTTVSTGGVGVYGQSAAATGFTTGVSGTVASTSGVGIYGQAGATSGSTIGVQAKVSSSSGTALVADNTAGGKIFSGQYNGLEKFSVDSTGNVTADGNVTAATGTVTAYSGTFTSSVTTNGQLISTVATGTPPLAVSSTTVVPNLNAALLQGTEPSAFARVGSLNSFALGQIFNGGITINGLTDGNGTANFTSNTAMFSDIVHVLQQGEGHALVAQTSSTSAGQAGIWGRALGASGGTYGVYGDNSSSSDNAVGVLGSATASTGATRGVEGTSSSTGGIGVRGLASSSTGATYGVYGRINSTSTAAAAVFGDATGASGTSYGVKGKNASTTGIGVDGEATTTGATATIGVRGIAASTGTSSAGVHGLATANSGTTFGVRGTVSSTSGYGGVFDTVAGGNILLGRTFNGASYDNKFRVDGGGEVYAAVYNTGGADFAESVDVVGSVEEYQPGDVVVVDSTGRRRFALAAKPYSTAVAGIHSTKPGVLATPHTMDDPSLRDEIPLAIVGIVPCKVTTENGPIAGGDLLVTSSTPGHAMRGTNRRRMLGAVVGKALEPLPEGKGVIQVLVTLQ